MHRGRGNDSSAGKNRYPLRVFHSGRYRVLPSPLRGPPCPAHRCDLTEGNVFGHGRAPDETPGLGRAAVKGDVRAHGRVEGAAILDVEMQMDGLQFIGFEGFGPQVAQADVGKRLVSRGPHLQGRRRIQALAEQFDLQFQARVGDAAQVNRAGR